MASVALLLAADLNLTAASRSGGVDRCAGHSFALHDRESGDYVEQGVANRRPGQVEQNILAIENWNRLKVAVGLSQIEGGTCIVILNKNMFFLYSCNFYS